MDRMASSMPSDEASNNVLTRIESAGSTIRMTKPAFGFRAAITASLVAFWDNSTDPGNNPLFGDTLHLSERNDKQIGSHHRRGNLLYHRYTPILPATVLETVIQPMKMVHPRSGTYVTVGRRDPLTIMGRKGKVRGA